MLHDHIRSIRILTLIPRLRSQESTRAAIDKMGQDGDVSSLIGQLANTDPSARMHAVQVLGTCGGAAVSPLLRAMRSRSLLVRIGVVEGLAALRDPRSVAPLASAARRDRSIEVRWAAVIALGEIGSAEAIPALVPLLRDENRYIRYGAAIALERLGWHPEVPDDAVYLLIARLDWAGVKASGSAALPALRDLLRAPDPLIRAEIVTTLGEIGDPDAAGACRIGLQDPDPRVRWRAVLASMNCGLSPRILPLHVAGRTRGGPDPLAAAILNFLFLGIGYNYIGKWWGFPVFMVFMFAIFLAQVTLAQISLNPLLVYAAVYPVTAVLAIHTYILAGRIPEPTV